MVILRILYAFLWGGNTHDFATANAVSIGKCMAQIEGYHASSCHGGLTTYKDFALRGKLAINSGIYEVGRSTSYERGV